MSNTILTQEQILEQMRTYLEDNQSTLTDWNIGSILRSFCESNANVTSSLYQYLLYQILQNWFTTSSGQGLDRCAAEFSISRKDGSKATCSQCRFTINIQSTVFIIPIGTVVATREPTPRYYETTQEGTISVGDTTVTVAIQAIEKGSDYNCPAYYIAEVQNVKGIVSVENLEPVTGGEDTEDDSTFRNRCLLYIRDGLARATSNALVYGALSVDGVKSAVPYANLKDHWEDFPYLKLKTTGSWTNIAGSEYYYGARKEGTGTVSLHAIMKKCIVHLWKTNTGGECTLSIDGVEETINLHGDTLTKITIEKEFETETWHEIILDTGINIGSIEKIEVKANYQGSNFIYIDDGSGQPSWDLVKNVYEELFNWKSCGEDYFVKRSEIYNVNISLTVIIGTYENQNAYTLQIQNALTEYINSLKMGEPLLSSQIIHTVLSITGIKDCKTSISEIAPKDYQVIRVGEIEIRYE